MRSDLLPFALPDLDDAEIREVAHTIQSGWITTGPKTRQFEVDFSRLIGAKHAIAVNSCTAALHLALDAIGLSNFDEVITTPLTFAATSEVVRYFNAKPVLVDIDPITLNIDPKKIEASLTKKTKAIIPVHLAGLPCDMQAIMRIAQTHSIRVIEDAAHAMPTIYKERENNALGDLVCFSFYATKTITTGEGGMICTENDKWAERCRSMSLHGLTQNAWNRYSSEGSWYYEINAPGYKYNMTDIAAAMGIAQMSKMDRMWKRRKEIAEKYNATFSNIEQLQIPYSNFTEQKHAWHLYILRLNLDLLKINRNIFIDELRKRKIVTGVHFIPLHIHPYYRNLYNYKPQDFPNAMSEYLRSISLPIYSKMSDQDINDVIDAVIDTVQINHQ
jgi:dTDP-4-amino-4,6-dideoxygalactose transaminase